MCRAVLGGSAPGGSAVGGLSFGGLLPDSVQKGPWHFWMRPRPFGSQAGAAWPEGKAS